MGGVAKRKWETYIKEEISDSDWEYICYFGQNFSLNVAIQENHDKILHLWYLTLLARLAKMFSGAADICWHCSTVRGEQIIFTYGGTARSLNLFGKRLG